MCSGEVAIKIITKKVQTDRAKFCQSKRGIQFHAFALATIHLYSAIDVNPLVTSVKIGVLASFR